MSTSPKKLAETPWKVTKNTVESGFKMFGPTFFQIIMVFYVLSLFVYLWTYTELFASWRANAEADKVRGTLFDIFGDRLGSEFIVFLIYAIATYVSVKKFGRNAKALSGPAAVIFLAALFQVILKLANKWIDLYDGPGCDTDTSVGCRIQEWYSKQLDNFFGDTDTSQYVLNIFGIAFGYLAAA